MTNPTTKSLQETRLSKLALAGVIITPTDPDALHYGVWTVFFDLHSGGCAKEPWNYIAIQAPKTIAIEAFSHIFKHFPHHVTCSCCGEDYSVSDGCWKDVAPNCPDLSILVIKDSDIPSSDV